MELSNISWYSEAYRVPLTGTKGPSPAPEKQPYAIIPPPPNTWHNAIRKVPFSWQPPNPGPSIRLPDGGARFVTPENTSLESSGGMLYTTASDTLHCTCWCMAWMQLLGHGTHSMKLSMHCSWANLKATWSLNVCSDWKLATSAHYEPQYPLTLHRHFTWPTTLWLNCCHSQKLSLCYNTTDSWLWNI